MKQDDDFGADRGGDIGADIGGRIAKLLDEAAESVDRPARDRLAEARRLALARHRAQTAPETAPSMAPAWAGAVSKWTEQSFLGVRYIVPFAALLLGLMGVLYVHTGGTQSEIADIDAGLLTDELPINAYLDQGFDSWLKRSSH